MKYLFIIQTFNGFYGCADEISAYECQMSANVVKCDALQSGKLE